MTVSTYKIIQVQLYNFIGTRQMAPQRPQTTHCGWSGLRLESKLIVSCVMRYDLQLFNERSKASSRYSTVTPHQTKNAINE